MTRLLLSISLCGLVLGGLLGGCRAAAPTPAEFATGVKSIMPSLDDQPWAGPGERVTLSSDEPRFDFNQAAFDATWTWDGGDEYADPFRVARRLDRDLNRLPSRVESKGSDQMYEFSDTLTIVCVNPVVVLIEPKPSTTTDLSGKMSRSALGRLINYGNKEMKLPAAIRSGTSVASLEGLKYYTQGESDEPSPIEVNADGVGTIDVPWGTLEVRQDLFSGYSVRAIATQ